jgi:DNA-binding response OmpR family regulator
MSEISCGVDELVVVDALINDYEELTTDEQLQLLTWRHFDTGEAALRSADMSLAALWLINMRLPDMEGVGLLGLVRNRARRSPVFLISDIYSPADEVSARVAGASAYLWKPADANWLRLCRHAIHRAAIRKGMQPTLG